MSNENEYIEQDVVVEESSNKPQSTKYDKVLSEDGGVHKLTGMYRNWFLDYASYVILERAVPNIEDGLKPVQRRILHAMKVIDDGRYNKVANIVGQTMQYHPHGDASIKDAMVQIGQKNLLIDCQGNWGNILTGDAAAAGRYIEARLSKFASDVVFNKKTTEWMLSYDGRKDEPVALPIKFPLLLAHGSEGIAVGLASKILPHNFIELIDASIAHLRGEEFTLYPDFPTGGVMDASRYNDGLRGGSVKVRAKISKIDNRTLAITEIPYTTTSESLKESIIKANEKGKIKIRKVDDNTAQKVEIIVQVAPDESSDKMIGALYAFTDCEVSISPNACVIIDNKPYFIGVNEILRRSVERTKELLKRELEIQLAELESDWHNSTLEKIFIENRIYHDIEGVKPFEKALDIIEDRLKPFIKDLRREVTREDILRLTEIRIKRITGYEEEIADKKIKALDKEMAEVKKNLRYLVEYALAYYERIKTKYGAGKERKTEIREFDSIEATKVAVNNAKLYVNREEGFFGIGKSMKDSEFVCDCSDIDDIIIFSKSGRYIITKVSDKAFFGKGIYYIGVFRRNDNRTVYNVLYKDGETDISYVKRCHISGVTRDKEYNITKGGDYTKLQYMSVNPNGEAEVLKVYFKPRPRLQKLIAELNFASISIKGRQSQGNIFTRNVIQKVALKEAGVSTLAGISVWFDRDVKQLNNEGRGELLGEFAGSEKTIIFTAKGQYYTAGFNTSLYFPEDLTDIEKFNPERIYSVVLYDASQKYFYLKRFKASDNDKLQLFIDETPGSYLVGVNSDDFPRIEVSYKGAHANRPADIIDVESFIGVKGHTARGKRVTVYEVDTIRFIEPERFKESDEVDSVIDDNEEIESIVVDIDTQDIKQEEHTIGSLFGDDE